MNWRLLRSEKRQTGAAVNTLISLLALEVAIDFLLDSDDQLVYLITDVVSFLLIKLVQGNDGINHLKPSGYYMYHQVEYSKIIHCIHTVYLCVFYGSQNKQRLFPYTALTDWFL